LTIVPKNIINKIEKLPTLPTVYSRLTLALSDPKSTPESLARVISSDQSASLKLLKVANSSVFGLPGRIETVKDAIIRLGYNEVSNIIFALSVINLFSKKKLLIHFQPVKFWEHSIAVGIISRLIGNHIGYGNLENCFLAGVIHDIGKLVFFESIEKEYLNVLKLIDEREGYSFDIEQELLGITHAEVGGMVADHWNIPQVLGNSIRQHHHLKDETSDGLSPIVYLANITARFLDLGFSGDNQIPKPDERIWSILRISSDFFDTSLDEILNQHQLITQMLLTD